MNNKVIGIISYLPDDESIRDKRIKLLTNLLYKLDSTFNLPIIIVAQNWKDFVHDTKTCTCYFFDKLGITGARKKLREIFLASSYEYLIMLDDDCIISGDKCAVNKYLMQIDDNPKMFYEFNTSLLKLFAIHRDILAKQEFSDVSPEKGEGFEDRIFVEELRKRFPDKRFILEHNHLEELSTSTKDPLSTWYTNQDLKEMIEKTIHYTNCKL